MKYSYKKGMLWISVFLALGLLPLAIAVAGDIPEFRSFWIEFGVALGFIGLALFGLQFLFSGRFIKIAPSYGMDSIINFHREIGIIAFILVLAHPAILISADPDFLSYFDPSVNFMRAVSLSLVTAAIIIITVTSLWRQVFKLNYEWWRLIHGFLAFCILLVGISHSIQVGHYLEPLWKKIAIAGFLGACMYLVIHTRFVRPWINKKKPYRAIKVKEEIGDCWSVTVEPDGHFGLNFKPGQFAWITLGPTPFSLQQHPFSFSSSARDDTITFTAKNEGDFTATWKHIKYGTKAWLEGPFGSFIPDKKHHLFLIMGGIGVTPAMSILRTLRDDNDPRKAVLVYANATWEDVTFRDELEQLKNEIDLTVVHVLEEPPDDWDGEEGFLDEGLLSQYLPENPNDFMYFICGPDPMMDIAEISLHNLGVSWNRIKTERFQIV